MSFTQWVTDFIPDDASTPAVKRNWRKRVALVACSAWLYVFLVITPVLFTGAPLIGRVAYANETDRIIDSKIAAAVSPIQKSVEALDGKVNESNALLTELVVESLPRQICRQHSRREKERDAEERRRIGVLIKELMAKYEKHTTFEFDIKDCTP